MNTKTHSVWKGYGYAWVTLGFFLISLVGHWLFGWFAYVSEQQAHAQPIQMSEFLVEIMRDTFENWQSEFLQVFVFIVLTTFLVHKKSHESPDTDYDTEASLRRIEAKLDGLEKQRSKS
jgi:hypothetical protein